MPKSVVPTDSVGDLNLEELRAWVNGTANAVLGEIENVFEGIVDRSPENDVIPIAWWVFHHWRRRGCVNTGETTIMLSLQLARQCEAEARRRLKASEVNNTVDVLSAKMRVLGLVSEERGQELVRDLAVVGNNSLEPVRELLMAIVNDESVSEQLRLNAKKIRTWIEGGAL